MSIDTAIIIVTYNGLEWVDRCLGSVYGRAGQAVIVVDNMSTDGTPDYIRSHYPGVSIIRATTNLGFGKANNLGIGEALRRGAKSVFLLNQDAWLAEGSLDHLLQVQQDHPVYGVLSPVHLNGAGDDMDERFEGYCRDSGYSRKAIFGGRQSGLGGFGPSVTDGIRLDEIHDSFSDVAEEPASPETHVDPTDGTRTAVPTVLPVDFVNAAGWLVSGECLRWVGGFHPAFFMYGEDLDYVHRLTSMGFRVGVCTGATLFHDREGRPVRDKTEEEIYFFGVRSTLALCNEKRQWLNPTAEPNPGNSDERTSDSPKNSSTQQPGSSPIAGKPVKQAHPTDPKSAARSASRQYRKKDILDEIYKPFLLRFFHSPIRSIRILWRKLIILQRVRKKVNSIPESAGEYPYLSVDTKINAHNSTTN